MVVDMASCKVKEGFELAFVGEGFRLKRIRQDSNLALVKANFKIAS